MEVQLPIYFDLLKELHRGIIDHFNQALEQLLGRVGEPMHIRFLIQPIMLPYGILQGLVTRFYRRFIAD
ncbi:MAG: hypothetical protein H0U70_01595 [Tatlockia sp.]|nr:hypothetical protein [Tatlockia sp.]